MIGMVLGHIGVEVDVVVIVLYDKVILRVCPHFVYVVHNNNFLLIFSLGVINIVCSLGCVGLRV